MPAQEEREPRDPHAAKDADSPAADGETKASPSEASTRRNQDILPPMKIRIAPDDAADARFTAPIILDAQPFVSSTPRLYAFVAASIAAGMVVGFLFGSHAGVKDALDAGASADGPGPTKALAWKPEIAAGLGDRRELARLVEEVRSMRAQVESLRHANETLRAADRLRALEAGREAALEGGRGNEKAAARLEKIEARLDLVERAKIDRTPTGAVPKPDRDGAPPEARREPPNAAPQQTTQRRQPAPGGYVLREASRDVALVQAPDGLLEEVARGDRLPGAGVVMAIEKRGRGWVVVTSRGVIDQRAY